MVKSWSEAGQRATGGGIGRTSAGSACLQLEAYSFGRQISDPGSPQSCAADLRGKGLMVFKKLSNNVIARRLRAGEAIALATTKPDTKKTPKIILFHVDFLPTPA
ncbi:hypothetical protein GX441_05705 [bacterium]|nr:hypothetical protein [bacterium]